MRRNVKGIISKISKKTDLEQNLPIYASELLTDYYQYALVGLAMNYYVLYEIACEDEEYAKGNIAECIDNINNIIVKGIVAPFDGSVREESLKQIDELRSEIMLRMDVVVDYVEKMLAYEYALNRVEYKFDNSSSAIGDSVINDEETARELFKYILAEKDNLVINDKIQFMVGQLPVRMAKSKFFDLISSSVSLYSGSDVSSLESFLYKIRSSATIYKPKAAKRYFTEVKKDIDYLASVDYANIDSETYKIARNKLDMCTRELNAFSDMYCAIQDVVNKAYAILLAAPYADGSSLSIEKNDICKSIIEDICKLFVDSRSNETQEEIDEEITQRFSEIEGRQEELYYYYAQLESELLSISEENDSLISSLMLSHQFECMKKCQLLLSSSSFVELSEDENNSKIADSDYVDNVKGKIISELSDLFAECSTPLRRAVMANVLNKLPVFFTNTNEALQYIMSSLSSCKDEAEKRASIDIINEWMCSGD